MRDSAMAGISTSPKWKLLSRISLSNEGSQALCRKHGFREVGVYEKPGKLDGRWLDVVIVERLTPANLT